jgi:ABC-type branched-subunit amino acid transport system substrate-binding protein
MKTNLSKTMARAVALMLVLAIVAAACGGGSNDAGKASETRPSASSQIDYNALGLWDDGRCDETLAPLVVGSMTVFESPVLSMKDQATALEASAEAFNERGGANGACIRVHNCDDKADPEQALRCVREIDDAGVVATVNDLSTVALADVTAAMDETGIPRVAGNVTPENWNSPNVYPVDASATGAALLYPQGLIEEGITDIGMVRVDVPATAALAGIMNDIYGDEGASIRFDAPVPGGTTDYGQFILGAEGKSAKGLMLLLGEQEAIQVVRAGQQLDTDLLMVTSPGSFSHSNMRRLGDFAEQMVFLWPYPPATFDLPVYEALRDDLAASGDELLQPENLKASPMRSWIGLYALLRVLRDAGVTTFTRADIKSALDAAKDVPMLGIFGTEKWTPKLDHPGAFKRAGTNHWAIYRWDPDATGGGFDGNFVERKEISFDEVLCDSPIGGPTPC